MPSMFARPSWLVVLAVASCSGSTPRPPGPRLGDLMTQVGRRFELIGRAATARRWDLAGFELGELHETLDDVPRAVMPEDVKVDVPQLAKAFVPTIESNLDAAVASRDPARLATAFEAAAGACNSCHQAAGKPYIEIPTVPGQSVPRLEPLP